MRRPALMALARGDVSCEKQRVVIPNRNSTVLRSDRSCGSRCWINSSTVTNWKHGLSTQRWQTCSCDSSWICLSSNSQIENRAAIAGRPLLLCSDAISPSIHAQSILPASRANSCFRSNDLVDPMLGRFVNVLFESISQADELRLALHRSDPAIRRRSEFRRSSAFAGGRLGTARPP